MAKIRIFAMLTACGTACAETALYGEEDTPEKRAEVEARCCGVGLDPPIAGTWTDVSENDALQPEPEGADHD